MIFSLKNKKVSFIKKDNDYILNDEKVNVKDILIVKATLVTEFAYLIVITEGEVYHLKSQSWLKQQKDDADDRKIVEKLNLSLSEFAEAHQIIEPAFVGCLPNKVERTSLYCRDNFILSPQNNFHFELSNIEVVFFERLTSYTRTFDVTIVQKNLKRTHFTCIERKKYLSDIKEIFKDYHIVETGPDPVDWHEAIKDFKRGKAWDDIYRVETSEDESEEWQPGETDESDTESDFEDEEEEIPVISDEKKRKLDQEWEEKSHILSCTDYDNWEKKQKIK